MSGVINLLEDFDPEMPYFITGAAGARMRTVA